MACSACGQIAKQIYKGTSRVVNKSLNVAEGWANVIITNPEVEILANERLDICNFPCKSRIEIMRINNIPIHKCGECDCPLIALVRSREKCKLNKW